jgi:hypothetical protein
LRVERLQPSAPHAWSEACSRPTRGGISLVGAIAGLQRLLEAEEASKREDEQRLIDVQRKKGMCCDAEKSEAETAEKSQAEKSEAKSAEKSQAEKSQAESAEKSKAENDVGGGEQKVIEQQTSGGRFRLKPGLREMDLTTSSGHKLDIPESDSQGGAASPSAPTRAHATQTRGHARRQEVISVLLMAMRQLFAPITCQNHALCMPRWA